MLATTPEIWPIKAKQIILDKGINIEALMKSFTEIWFPWSDQYNSERTYFSLRIELRPLFIIKPHTIDEIETILNYVTDKQLTIRIMNGRHSSALVSSDVLVDMSFFTNKTLEIKNENEEILIAGAGNTQGALNEFLFSFLQREIYSHFGHFIHPRVDTEAFPGGSAASVGIAGISTVGGVGTLCRSFGLTVDHTLSYTITVPPTNSLERAKTINASEKENSDLFWALRGGGANNFGIISEITFTVLDVPTIIVYTVKWSWKNAKKVLEEYQQSSINRPNNYNEDLSIYYNNGLKGIELAGLYIMLEGESFIQATKNIKKELHSLVGELVINEPIRYSDIYRQKVRDRVYFNFSIIQPIFSDNLKAEYSVDLINLADKRKLTGPVSITFTLLGGKISKVSRKATAYYPRHKQFFIDIATFWNTIQESASMDKWTQEAVELYLYDHSYLYLGFPLTFNLPQPPNIYYGKNTKLLKQIKKKYDPLNILTSTGTI
ncbi:MAG: FAD-binding oxidoreductase [Barrevirus sp.]|uniref:FAD-binding oxidoreductase n=1 Tax=Barrevirus sp. TaxID=2487763 RepID=A0A3G4ZS03_9VIRU|nr:MAG: FAD-binding oxidoreductase [Barrevirus sp.]